MHRYITHTHLTNTHAQRAVGHFVLLLPQFFGKLILFVWRRTARRITLYGTFLLEDKDINN